MPAGCALSLPGFSLRVYFGVYFEQLAQNCIYVHLELPHFRRGTDDT
jgi:hypothetical protein